jgi:arylformamidase
MPEFLFRGLDQSELDREYSPSATVASLDPYVAKWRKAGDRARHNLQNVCVHYGAHADADEVFDAFRAKRPGSPVHVFLHGGYWRALSKDEASFYAEHIVSAGAAFVAVNYSLAPHASLDTIVDQCRRCLAWVYGNAQALNADAKSIHVAGHSAGGHLAGMLAVTDWARLFGLPPDLVRGACVVSGLFDMEPVRLSHVNGWLRLDHEAAYRNSPIRHIPALGCPLIVAWADGETGEFVRQSREFGEAWMAKGFDCQLIEEAKQNHFSVIELMGDPSSRLGKAVLDQMKLSVPSANAEPGPQNAENCATDKLRSAGSTR